MPDPWDACPTLPGVASAVLVTSGCPPPGYYDDGLSSRDRDGDGVLDPADSCPEDPGVTDYGGCAAPPDKDGDGIADATDACRNEAGPAREDPHVTGCPTAWVDGDRIAILGGVGFASGRADLLPESTPVLDAVASVVVHREDLGPIRIEGHTDGRGGMEMNRRLSTKRAEAVVAYLVAHGVAASRLSALGLGADRPIDTNETEAGRATNRRVEFHVTTPPTPDSTKPSAAFADLGPAPAAPDPGVVTPPETSPVPAPATPSFPSPTPSLDTPGL